MEINGSDLQCQNLSFLAQCRVAIEVFCDEKYTALFRIMLGLVRFWQS